MHRKKVLCVCSYNIMRSPTISWVLSNPPYNYDTRSCGTDLRYAIVALSKSIIMWADEIVCAEERHEKEVLKLAQELSLSPKTIVLGIPDRYLYKDPELIELVKKKYEARKN